MTCGYRQEECGILVYGRLPRTAYRVGTRLHASYVCASPASAMTLLLRPSLDTRTRESKVLSISFSVSLNLSQSRLSGAARRSTPHSTQIPSPDLRTLELRENESGLQPTRRFELCNIWIKLKLAVSLIPCCTIPLRLVQIISGRRTSYYRNYSETFGLYVS